MTDKVLCPWCGRRMKIYFEEKGLEDYMAWSLCTYGKCAAEGPFIRGAKTEEEAIRLATEAALRRYEPPCRPMTLEEALERCIVYIEYRTYDEVQSDPILLHYIWDEWLKETILTYQMYGIMGENTDIGHPDDYGKTWRCWPRKPTEQERKEAKFND